MIKLLVLTLLFFASSTQAQQAYNKLNVKELDVTSRVNVTSTTRSSKPCPAMTETQRNAIATPLNGSCIYNTTTSKLNVYNGAVWKAAGGGVDNWSTATAYSVDDIVIESSKIYQCLIAHTSGTFATDLAALNWTEISSTVPVNLTGPITSVGNATSIASQTGTGSTFVVQDTPTLTTPNIGAATGTSLTLAGNISAYNYDKDNLLVNGNIENPLSSEWTCTVGTCTRTTTALEFSKDTAALKVALSAQIMNVSQTVTTPSGIQKQGFARVIYRVPATMADFAICTLVDGSEQSCASSTTIKDDTFRSIEIPLTFGATSAGIKFKTTSSYTANAYFDGAILSQGLGLQNLQLDNVYSAQVSSAGVVSGENKDFISTCSAGVPAGGYTTCNFNSGYFTVTPNCFTTKSDTSTEVQGISSVSSTSVVVVNNTASNRPFALSCQKSSTDYLASSANVYSQASGNYSRRAYTPTFTGFGTVSGVECFESRDAEYSEIDCRFTTGTTTSTEARVSLPSSLTTSTATTSIANFGSAAISLTGGNTYTVLSNGGLSYVTFGLQNSGSGNGLSGVLGTIIGNTITVSFKARIPISGWSNSNVIVGSFEGIEKCVGNECDDTFSAQVSNTGVVSGENVNFINGNASLASNDFTITFTAGIFTVAPNCWASAGGTSETSTASVTSVSSTTLVVASNDFTSAPAARAFIISCQKTGVDYFPKTAKVASSIGVPTVPGISTEAIDSFSVSYGTTNATTACSASPCSYLDQIGTAVTSITRSGTGVYTMNLAKTYTKIKCVGNGALNTASDYRIFFLPMNYSSVNNFSFTTRLIDQIAYDSFGTIHCQGLY